MAEVILNEGESLESALRRFKRKVQQEDIIKEVKKHSYYMKPGDKRQIVFDKRPRTVECVALDQDRGAMTVRFGEQRLTLRSFQ